jgi:hypothetical protein
MSARELLRANDLRFLTVASTLSQAEWAAPSLCDEWTNHDVLAHLVIGCRVRFGTLTAEIARRRGSFDDANADLASNLAATRSPADLLDDFARLVDRPRGMGRYFPRLTATDTDWTHGVDGPRISGRAADLVSALGDRPCALARLSGDGVTVLASRVLSRRSRTGG